MKRESILPDDGESIFGTCKSVKSIDIVSDIGPMDGATLPYRGCIVEGKDVDLYISPQMDIYQDNPRNFAIRIKPNGKFYFMKPGAIANMQDAKLISGTNIYVEYRVGSSTLKIARAMDIRDSIRADSFDSRGDPIRYTFDDTLSSVDIYNLSNVRYDISLGPITNDGKTLFWTKAGLLYKSNIEAKQLNVKYVPGPFINSYNVPYASHNIKPIDDEGRYVYLAGKLDMLVYIESCGPYEPAWLDNFGVTYLYLAETATCKMRSFKGIVDTDENAVVTAKLSEDKIQFKTYRNGVAFLVEFAPQDMDVDDPERLTYLALGDSYSSGEGDNGIFFGKKYYRAGTDENGPPREKCHISTRSYPYLLANTQGLEKNDWNVVACSGALVERDYYDSDDDAYFGQNGRLGGLNDNQVLQYQADAKNEFMPGRVRQIEFVKEYKPKVITITGSGNDAGFSDVLAACVTPLQPNDTCSYAADMSGKLKVGREIRKQYDNVHSLVHAIKQESPQTTVYYVGYPQFLKETNKTCGLGVSLSIEERKVFRAANSYLNKIIEVAAESEGAIYVDIENSLENHLLCSDDPYVTGYNADCSETPLNWFKGKDECEESFHPKPAGHALIASSILAKHSNIMNSQPCAPPNTCVKVTNQDDVEVPKTFKDAFIWEGRVNAVPSRRGGDELVAQNGNANASIQAIASNVESNSKFDTYVTSEPLNLGEVWSDAEGKLTIDKAVPESLRAGYHTLHAEGNDSLGKPIELWWTIRIFGKDGDIDEDGISDNTDKCIFMLTLNIDEDNDGIDDGCDSDIGGSGRWSKYQIPYTVYGAQNSVAGASVLKLESPQLTAEEKNRGIISRDKNNASNNARENNNESIDTKISPLIVANLVIIGGLVIIITRRRYARR